MVNERNHGEANVTEKTKEEADLFGTFRKTQYICRKIGVNNIIRNEKDFIKPDDGDDGSVVYGYRW